MKSAVMNNRRIPPALPRSFIRHSLFTLIAVAVYGLFVFLADFVEIPSVLKFILAIPAWIIIAAFFIYYVVIYPIIHAAQRYRGNSQTLWLGWLSLELCVIGFGLVRVFYFFNHLLPDIRKRPPYDDRFDV